MRTWAGLSLRECGLWREGLLDLWRTRPSAREETLPKTECERNTLTSPLLPHSSASHWISLPRGQLAKEPGKCHSSDAEQSREGWEMELRASRKTLPYSWWNSWTLHHFWAFLFTFSQAQDFSLVNIFYFIYFFLASDGSTLVGDMVNVGGHFCCLFPRWLEVVVLLVFSGLDAYPVCMDSPVQ